MERMHSACSHNKLFFTPDNNLVVGGINIPCTGKTLIDRIVVNVYALTRRVDVVGVQGAATAYDSTKCGAPEIFGWMQDALAQVQVNICAKRHHIMMRYIPGDYTAI